MTQRLDGRGAIVTGAGSGRSPSFRWRNGGACSTCASPGCSCRSSTRPATWPGAAPSSTSPPSTPSSPPRASPRTAIAPGLIDTPLTAMLTQPPLRDEFLDNTPLGRIGTTADVAAAALFLASDDSAWITGDILLVDGGGHTKRYPELARRFAGQDR